MEKEKVLLELTPGELLMLQELTEDLDVMPQWMYEISESLRKKALNAYQKPVMAAEEYERRISAVREIFAGEPAEFHMIHGEKMQLRFFYRVEGEA